MSLGVTAGRRIRLSDDIQDGVGFWSATTGAGFSVTLIFSAGSFTNTEQHEQSATRSLDWGLALTEPPLKGLNRIQNLESGANGMQLTTNSLGIGQHTLELNH